MDLLRCIQRGLHICWKRCAEHRLINEKLLENSVDSLLIENQKSMSDVLFGKSTMAYAGCEVIAVYNALCSIGCEYKLSDLIYDFERDGMILSGRFGTAPGAIVDCLKKLTLSPGIIYDSNRFDNVSADAKIMILTIYNDRENILKQIHTVCVTRTYDENQGRNIFTAHNVYGNGQLVTGDSIGDIISSINEGRAKGICLIYA